MKTFTTLNIAKTIKCSETGEMVTIFKVQKDGTKRIFFKPTVNGNPISRTLWARLCEAEGLSRRYLNNKN